ncbi:hypothetical protein [Frankia sp. CiP3]|uniref:hypothetical protein n=1 Tax=Frankia sp. CiP3 TaxID=2880971 RepID=UPI001EF5E672|nr:hypothetical protein [Frankia sp. CiP3]
MSTNPRAASLDGRRAALWWAARIPAWVLPALICAWFAAALAAKAGDAPACSVAHPGDCGPDLGSALLGVCLLGVPVLLWWSPAAGCTAGIVFCVADVLFDTRGPASVVLVGYGMACAAAAAWLLRVRVGQRAITDHLSGVRVLLAWVRPGGLRRSRLLAVAAFAVMAAGLYAWYAHVGAVEDRHLAAAEVQSVQIVAVGKGKITVVLASGARHALAVADTAGYPTGSSVPVRTDPGDPGWVRLLAEPDDPTGWAVGGFAAAAIAVALMSREWVGWRARRGLVTGRHRGIQVRIMTDERGAVLVYAADDVRGERPLAVVPVRWATSAAGAAGPGQAGAGRSDEPGQHGDLHGRGESGGFSDERAFGRAWRGEVDDAVTASPAMLVGGLHDDAWPAFVIGDYAVGDSAGGADVLLPVAPLRTFRSPPSTWWRLLRGGRGLRAAQRGPGGDDNPAGGTGGTATEYGLPGRPVPAGDADAAVPALPTVLRGPGRYRAAGATALGGGLFGAPIAVLLGLDVVPAVWLGGVLLANGLFATGRSVILDERRLTVRGPMFVHSVAWGRLHGARLVGDRLVLAWEPATVVAVGPFAPVGESPGRREQTERTGAAMMTLRARAVAGAACVGAGAGARLGRQVTRAPGFGFVVVAAYVLLVTASWWWHAHGG